MDDDSGQIGARARMVRRRRGMTLAVAAGLTGISESYLSTLESGQRSFVRRGLIEDLADALGCSPIDLTGLPAISPDRRAVAASSAVPAVAAALHDATLDDVPDIPTRPVHVLQDLAARANAAADEVEYLPGNQLGDLLSELHVLAATTKGDQQHAALATLVEACVVARSLAWTMGHDELAVTATRRGWDAARRIERPDLIGLMAMGRGLTLNRIGARRRATAVVNTALVDIATQPGPTEHDTATAEAHGMLHLAAAHLAARAGQASDADTHLDEAATIARHTGERNHMRYHFGPQNVAAWTLAVSVETGRGPAAAERLATQPIDVAALGSADRVAAVHFDMARAYAQADGARDLDALRQLDLADRTAPLRIRRDPIVQELVRDLDRRAKRQVWELGSLKRRVGIT